jgi:WXG100 family type VII secretion target
MTIEVDHATFRAAIDDVRDGAETLRDARDRIDREVGVLLDGGWSGVAAASFAEGWSDWRAGAQDVLDGLVAMGQLLDAVHADLADRDLAAQVDLDGVARRIVGRLDA